MLFHLLLYNLINDLSIIHIEQVKKTGQFSVHRAYDII